MFKKLLFAITFISISTAIGFAGYLFFVKQQPALAQTINTYYIDYANGSDSNNGISSATPWKHAPGDPNASGNANITLSSGDIVIFKKGVTYQGQMTINSSGSLHDSGINATITSGGVFSSIGQNFLTTVSVGNYVYIYNYEDDCNPTCGVGTLTEGGKYLDSVGLWKVLSVDSDTQLTLGTYAGATYNGAGYATNTMYYRIVRPIHLTSTSTWGSGDAVIDSSSVGAYFEKSIIIDNQSRIMISNLKFISTKNVEGFPSATCINPTYAAIYGHYTTTYYDIYIFNNIFTDVWGGAKVGGRAPYSVVKDNKVTNWGYYSLLISGNNSLIEDNVLDNGMYGLGGGMGSQKVIRRNTVLNTNKLAATNCNGHANAFFPISGDTIPSYYGRLYSNYISNSISGIPLTYSNGGTYGWHIFNNVVIGFHGVAAESAPYGRAGSGSVGIQLLGAPHAKVYNNTIFSVNINGSVGFVFAVKIGKDSGTINSNNIILRNNIIYNTASSSFGSIQLGADAGDTSPSGFSSEYNTIYTPNRNTHIYYQTATPSEAKSFSYWQGTLGYDNAGYSLNSNPSLDMNYKPTAASSVKDAGINLSAYFTFDKDDILRPQGLAWDIGAYEYIPLKGDFNSDSKVNDLDFTSFKNAFKSIFNSIFDLNSDNTIDVKDLGVLMSGWLE